MEPFVAATDVNRYSRMKRKLKFTFEDIKFLKKCLKYNISPKFILLKVSRNSNNKLEKIINKAKRSWLKLEISNHYRRINNISLKLYNLNMKIINKLNQMENECWLDKKRKIDEVIQRQVADKKRRLIRKFNYLKKLTGKKPHRVQQNIETNTIINVQENLVYNYSNEHFTSDEIILLNKGLKYKPTPRHTPVKEIVLAAESKINQAHIPLSSKLHIQEQCRRVLSNANTKTPTFNLREINIVKSLKSKNVFYSKPDKSNGVVILNKNDYFEKMQAHIDNGPYSEIKDGRWKNGSPLNAMQTLVRTRIENLQKYHGLNYTIASNLIISNPRLPCMYGLVKTHKENKDMRPIVSSINSPTYNVAKMLVKRFDELNMIPSKSVKNSIDFTKTIENVLLRDDEILVSFDIKSLFPSIPIKETLNYINNWINEQDIESHEKYVLKTLLNTCMTQTQFTFNGKFYKSTNGTSMGNPLSPFVAEFFMSWFENKIKDKVWFPRVWCRYVDDIFCILKRSQILEVLSELDQVHTNISFTVEEEHNNTLPFLDVLVKRHNNAIEFGIYHKHTSSLQQIPFSSHHPISQKLASFHSSLHRLCNLPITHEEHIKEKSYIERVAAINGYDQKIISNLYIKHKRRAFTKINTTLQHIPKLEKKQYISIPYYPTITNKIQQIFLNYNIHVSYSSRGKLKDLLNSPKPEISDYDKSGIYKLSCTDCDCFYVGKTKRKLADRLREHISHIKNNQPNRSAMAKHCLEDGHSINEIILLDEVRQPWKLPHYENFHIYKNNNPLLVNLDLKEISRSPLYDFVQYL